MRRLFLSCLVIVAVSSAQSIRVAVLNFKDYSGRFRDFTYGLPDLLSTKLAATGDARVVERAQIDRVLEEQNLSRTSEFDPETAVRIGKLLGVEAVVMGGVYASGDEVQVAARVVTVVTGEVQSGYSVRGTSSGSMFDLVDALARKVILAWSATLVVQSPARGASVFVDGDYRGTAPVTLSGLRTGTYLVKVTLPGCYDWSYSVRLTRGDERIVFATHYEIPPPPPPPKPAAEPLASRNPCLFWGIVIPLFGVAMFFFMLAVNP